MRDSRDWTIAAPFRALLWWPGAAFVLVLIAPEAAAAGIAGAGAALAAAGVVASAVSRRVRAALLAADLTAAAACPANTRMSN